MCSKHFDELDLYTPKTDSPSACKIHRLCKGAMPCLNLRGKEEDERQFKLCSNQVVKSLCEHICEKFTVTLVVNVEPVLQCAGCGKTVYT